MIRRFRQWLAAADGLQSTALEEERSRRLERDNALQALRLELDQANLHLSRLNAERQRACREEADRLSDHLDAQLVAVVTPMARPLAQLLTQRQLVEDQGKELAAREVLVVCRRLWEALAAVGVESLEAIDDHVAFNPDHHQPLNQAVALERGEAVRVRMPGIRLKGRVLQPAAVEPVSPEDRRRPEASG